MNVLIPTSFFFLIKTHTQTVKISNLMDLEKNLSRISKEKLNSEKTEWIILGVDKKMTKKK